VPGPRGGGLSLWPMLFTASTVKDSPANTGFFVAANLASGVDHMFVFLDSPRDSDQQQVRESLDSHPHVTCIPTERRSWWQDDRPGSLNVRQRINANWARSVLEPFAWAEWLFHIDGDEVARVDRDAVADVPADQSVVRLPPLEAVSRLHAEARPTAFKRLLDDGELNLLQVLGAIDEPTNQTYFHGHVMGKSGVRPASGTMLTLHDAVTPEGRVEPGHEDPRLQLLHYDAVSGEEFVRKWIALAGAGAARYRPSRAPAARALKTLIAADLPEETRARYLQRIYQLTTEDDTELLADLGLLVEVDPEQDGHSPAPFPDGAAAQLADRIHELSSAPKPPFFAPDAAKDGPGQGAQPRRGPLRRLARRG